MLHFANCTLFSKKARRFIAQTHGRYHLLCLVETHVSSPDAQRRWMRKAGFDSAWSKAKSTGRGGSSGGVCIARRLDFDASFAHQGAATPSLSPLELIS